MCDSDHAAHPATRVSRRGFLRTGTVAALMPAAIGAAFAADAPPPGAAPPNAMAPAEILKRVMEGNARYAANTPNERDFSAGRAGRDGARS